MHSLSKTIDYLTEFFSSKYHDYFEMMQDAGSSHYPPAFDGESDVIQGIRNIVHNISDNYCDLSIPTGFASPNMLYSSLVGFRDMAEKQLKEAQDINKSLGEPWFDVISHSVKINSEVMEAIEYALTLSDKPDPAVPTALERLNHLINKLPIVADALKSRRKKAGLPRDTLLINDEYDVQDLMRAILTIDFDDIRSEEWCPSYVGSSKRTDFLLKKEKIIIEVKKTRTDHNQKKIGEELIIDITNYKNHSDCEHLVCYVWDNDRKIQNPVGLKTDLEKTNKGFVTVHIYQ